MIILEDLEFRIFQGVNLILNIFNYAPSRRGGNSKMSKHNCDLWWPPYYSHNDTHHIMLLRFHLLWWCEI